MQRPFLQRFGGSQQTPPQKPNPLAQQDGFHSSDGMMLPSGRFSAGGPMRTQPLCNLLAQQTPLMPLSGCAMSAVHGNFLPSSFVLPPHLLMHR
ncbi:MAG TPA: hypothetical protein VMN35_05485 [Gaiellaceae bacterium]|nr:hypothetical protein [Gaiellaceae bacterium]